MTLSVVEFSEASTTSSTSTLNVAIAATPIAGDIIIMMSGTDRTTTTRLVSGVSGLGATWSVLHSNTQSSNYTHDYWIGTGANASGNVTVTMNSSRDFNAYVLVIRGFGGTPTSAVVAASASTGTSQAGSSQTATLGEFVCSVGSSVPALTWPSAQNPAASWTTKTPVTPTGGGFAYAAGYAIPASSGTHNTSLTSTTSGKMRISQVVLTGPPSTTGTVHAVASAPTVSIAGVVTISGQVAATPTHPVAAIAGAVPTMGVVTATASAPSVTISGNVGGIVAGVVSATASAPVVSIAGTVPPVITGTVNATPTHPVVHITSATEVVPFETGADLSVAFTDVAFDSFAVSFATEAALDVVEPLDYEPLRVSFETGADLRVAIARPSTIDPVTGLPQYRLLAVTPDGTVLGELPKAAIGDHVLGLGLGDESLSFSLPKYDAGNQHVLPAYGKIIPEVQLWRGPNLEAWVRIDGEPGNNDGTLTYDCSGLGEHLKGRLVGKTPKTNWLINGDFSNGFYGWSFDYDAGSVPAVAPLHSIVDVDFFGKDAKALQLGGATSYTKSAVETATVFIPNTATYMSGGEAKIEAAGANIPDGADVHVIGHTAYNYIDGDYGNGLALSLDRAQAAKATLHAQNSTLTFSLPPGWDDIDPSKRVDDGTVGGRGRYVPVASNDTYAGQAKNRRVELQYVATIDANAGQFARAALTVGEITIPYGERALPVTFKGWAAASSDIVKTSGGYGVLITLYDVSGSTLVKVDEAYSTLDESSSRTLWQPHEGTVTIPANNKPHRLGVRFYAPGGYVLWTAGGVYPEEALFFNKVDQAFIVQGLVEHAQDPAMGKLGDVPILIGTRTFETGRTRTKTYPYHERRQIFDATAEFEALHNGMDLSLEITPTDRVVATHYPRRGQESGVTFELGSNIVAFQPPTDVTSSGTRWIAQALESSGADREEGIVTDLTGMGGMLIERLAYAEPDTPVTELESAAESSSKRYGHPVTMLTVTVGRVGVWDPALTSWMLDHVKVGDLVDVVINDGPYQIYGPHRVTKRTLTPDTDTLRYQLAPEV